jgi:hypothetical protein
LMPWFHFYRVYHAIVERTEMASSSMGATSGYYAFADLGAPSRNV